MNFLARLTLRGAAACATIFLTVGCSSTTGDPTQGGLFGWSETKARQRQAEKRANVAGAEAELSRETARGAELDHRQTATDRNLAAATAQREEAMELLRIQRDKLVADATHLEAISPTTATASKARSLRLKVTTIAANESLSPQERSIRLHKLEGAIDAAMEKAQTQ